MVTASQVRAIDATFPSRGPLTSEFTVTMVLPLVPGLKALEWILDFHLDGSIHTNGCCNGDSALSIHLAAGARQVAIGGWRWDVSTRFVAGLRIGVTEDICS